MLWFEESPRTGDPYHNRTPLPDQIKNYPGLALVRIDKDGRTQPGWGANEYMENFKAGAFEPDRALKFYDKYSLPFAVVMRSVPFICVDIDGKNGGLETARLLDLERTMAEKSKSGNGYHLFYRMPYSPFHEKYGYHEFPDLIGLLPGIDIKGTGVVYHYVHQLWNNLDLALCPPSLADVIGQARDVRREYRLSREGVGALDQEELIMLWDQLLDSLAKPVNVGSRNNRLYQMGAKMLAAGVPFWDQHIQARAEELGLPSTEAMQIIVNIERYS